MDLDNARFWIGSKNTWDAHFCTFLHVFWQMRTWDTRFLINKYLRCTFLACFCMFLHVFAWFCMFLHIVCTWDTLTPAIKYWPSTARIFYSWTLYYIPLSLWYTILSYTSFSILQKTCISRPYCMGFWISCVIQKSCHVTCPRLVTWDFCITCNFQNPILTFPTPQYFHSKFN